MNKQETYDWLCWLLDESGIETAKLNKTNFPHQIIKWNSFDVAYVNIKRNTYEAREEMQLAIQAELSKKNLYYSFLNYQYAFTVNISKKFNWDDPKYPYIAESTDYSQKDAWMKCFRKAWEELFEND